MTLLDEINAAMDKVLASRTTLVCAPQRYDEIKEHLMSEPQFDGLWNLLPYQLLADDPTTVYVLAPGVTSLWST